VAVERNYNVSYYIQISTNARTTSFDATDRGERTTFGARLRTLVGGTGLGMSTTNKFVWGFASSDPNSDKKVSTTSDFAVARIF
jgi:hypothetical protein